MTLFGGEKVPDTFLSFSSDTFSSPREKVPDTFLSPFYGSMRTVAMP